MTHLPQPLIITNGYPIVTETFIHDYVRLLLARGLTPRVLPTSSESQPEAYPGADAARATGCSLGAPRRERGARPPDVPLPPWAAEFARGRGCGHDLPAIAAAIRAQAAVPRTVVHAQFLSAAGILTALALGTARPAPAILELHGWDVFGVARRRPAAAGELLCHFDAVVVSCGHMEYTTRLLLEPLDPARWPRVVRINHGIDLDKLDALASPPDRRTGAPPRVVMVGRFVEKKGHRYLIAALPALLRDWPGLEVLLIGTGGREAEARQQAAELGVAGARRFLGALPNVETLGRIATADLVVLPCVESATGDLDAIPNCLAEAQALGVPVVSTWLSGVPELVRHGVTGLLVPPRDAAALARAIATLLGAPRLRAELGRNGVAWASAALDMRRQLDAFLALYAELLDIRR